MAAIHHWPLHQLDIKNALHGEMQEVYMDQHLGFMVSIDSLLVCHLWCSLYGLKQFPHACAWFGRFSTPSIKFGMNSMRLITLCFFILTPMHFIDDATISSCSCPTPLVRSLKYLGILVAQSSSGIAISHKFCFNILTMIGEPLKVPRRYGHLIGRLKYLTVTQPGITFVVGMSLRCLCILRYIKDAPRHGLLSEYKGNAKIICYFDADLGSQSNRRSTFGYCVLIRGNMISLRSEKQNIVARSSDKAKDYAMAAAACEIT
ncbi:putative mitochondrial protein, partial [Mucuna pruriens]